LCRYPSRLHLHDWGSTHACFAERLRSSSYSDAKTMGIAEFILRDAEGLHPSYILIRPTCDSFENWDCGGYASFFHPLGERRLMINFVVRTGL
jgi:hypothetical protein